MYPNVDFKQWSEYADVFVKIAAPIATIYGLYKFIEMKIRYRPSIKRITDPNSAEFYDTMNLHQNYFSDNVADDHTDFARWIEEKHDDFEDILICMKYDRKVVGYMFAQFYKKEEIVFLSYLAIDQTCAEARQKCCELLLQYLVKYVNKKKLKWRYIVAEIEEKKRSAITNKLEMHAPQLMRTFQFAAKKVENIVGQRLIVYRLKCDYFQPILRPEDIGIVDNNTEDFRQWILYIPNSANQIHKEIDKNKCKEIFEFLFKRLYSDSFVDNSEYQLYIKNELERQLSRVGETVYISDNWRDHSKNEAS